MTIIGKFDNITAMLKIRLQRVGRKHDPSYRIVVTTSTTGPKSNKHVEILGHYDAIRKTKTVDAERVKHWMSEGAQVSPTVHNILVAEGVVEGKKVNVLPKKAPIIDEEKIAAEKEAAEKAEADAKAAAEAAEAEANAPEEEAAEETTEEAEPAAEEVAEVATEEAPAEEEEKKDEVSA